MGKLSKYELLSLKAYLELPMRKLLNNQFELEESYIAGHVQRFLKGERFSIEFTAFSEAELNVITPLLQNHIQTNNGKDLLTAFHMTKVVCNIMNKYIIVT